MSSATDHRPSSCPNCGLHLAELPPPVHHCPQCGQETHLHPPTLFEFVHEFITHYVALEGALWRSLKALLLSPGQLSLDYFAGRRRQHVLPLRIYLTASFLFFLALKLGGGGPSVSTQAPIQVDARAAAASSVASAPAAASAASASRAAAAAAGPSSPHPSVAETAGSTPAHAGASAAASAAASASLDEDDDEHQAADPAANTNEREIWQSCVHQPEQCSRFENLMARAMLKSTDPQTSLQLIFKQMLGMAPYAIFMMLPLFAGLLKLVYWRRGMAYGAHVVFSLHVHAYWFLAGLLVLWLPNPFSGLLMWSMPVHAVLAMKRVYAGSWHATLGRAALVSVLYGLLLAAGTLALAVSALMAA